MIEFRGVHKRIDGRPVLRGVDLVVRDGETLALLGPSGTGKSVLLKHAIGLLRPDAGDVLVDGVSVAEAGEEDLRRIRRLVGYVFQNAALFDSLTVEENLRLARDESVGWSRAAWRAEAESLVRRVNLAPDVLDRRPEELSGGMRKRVGLARAIVSRPRYLLYDEPTAGLDPVNAARIDALMVELGRELGVTSIVVTHDLDTAFRVGERIALLYEGRIRACGAPEEMLRSDDAVVRRFLHRRTAAPAPRGVGNRG